VDWHASPTRSPTWYFCSGDNAGANPSPSTLVRRVCAKCVADFDSSCSNRPGRARCLRRLPPPHGPRNRRGCGLLRLWVNTSMTRALASRGLTERGERAILAASSLYSSYSVPRRVPIKLRARGRSSSSLGVLIRQLTRRNSRGSRPRTGPTMAESWQRAVPVDAGANPVRSCCCSQLGVPFRACSPRIKYLAPSVPLPWLNDFGAWKPYQLSQAPRQSLRADRPGAAVASCRRGKRNPTAQWTPWTANSQGAGRPRHESQLAPRRRRLRATRDPTGRNADANRWPPCGWLPDAPRLRH